MGYEWKHVPEPLRPMLDAQTQNESEETKAEIDARYERFSGFIRGVAASHEQGAKIYEQAAKAYRGVRADPRAFTISLGMLVMNVIGRLAAAEWNMKDEAEQQQCPSLDPILDRMIGELLSSIYQHKTHMLMAIGMPGGALKEAIGEDDEED